MIDSHLISYRGPSFPLRAGSRGYFGLSQDITLINESIRQILGTPVGSRVMRRDFGSRIHELLFEPNDQVLQSLAIKYAYEDVIKWEKRIFINENEVDAEINSDFQSLRIIIPYRMRRIAVRNQADFVLNLEQR